jgi:hypothetical protein
MRPLDPRLLRLSRPARRYLVLTVVVGVATAGLALALAWTVATALARTQHDPVAANALTMELNHLLIPVNYTRTGPFEHDLALRTDPLPGLSDSAKLGQLNQSSDDFYFLRTRLTRERNRVEHALRSAMRAVERA